MPLFATYLACLRYVVLTQERDASRSSAAFHTLNDVQGLAHAVRSFARTRRSAALACCLCGIAIFFDDDAHTLILGSTFRPVMDAMAISREKLACIVDLSASPITAIAPVSSWLGAPGPYALVLML
jgi:hypothetical protein